VETSVKRLIVPLAALGLTLSPLAAPAQAEPVWSVDPLAAKAPDAYGIAKFWTNANGAALRKATRYDLDEKPVHRLASGRSATLDDGKPGLTPPTGGTGGTAAKVRNINLPRTIGKVFFVTGKGEPAWCSATSIQSKHRNLVATAGHCVYDIDANKDVLNKWVFVPGYYQGKTPWGIYVGQEAVTHYDLATYEDFDHDYAFVAVTNGIAFDGAKEVSRTDFDAWAGDKWVKPVAIDKAAYDKCRLDLGACWVDGKDGKDEQVGPDYPGALLTKVEVDKTAYDKAKTGAGNGNKLGEPVTLPVTQKEYEAYKGLGTKGKDAKGNYTVTTYYVQRYIKPGASAKYYKDTFWIGRVKDLGPIGEVVGGQGIGWNLPTGQATYVFGYPAAPHPDGHKAYTGLTPKWCYGKTAQKIYSVSEYKVTSHVALKCSMTAGADGAPWLLKYNNAKRLGYVNGVTSLFHDQDGNDRVDYNSSPYFDGETAAVYTKANDIRPLTIVGPDGQLLK
jgi:hypothetical protein